MAEGDEDRDDRELASEKITPTRPYFEVLVVDDMSVEQEAALREELRKLRRENAELRRANSILKAASAFFAAEIDRPHLP